MNLFLHLIRRANRRTDGKEKEKRKEKELNLFNLLGLCDSINSYFLGDFRVFYITYFVDICFPLWHFV